MIILNFINFTQIKFNGFTVDEIWNSIFISKNKKIDFGSLSRIIYNTIKVNWNLFLVDHFHPTTKVVGLSVRIS